MLWRAWVPIWLVTSCALGALAPRPHSPELAYRLGVLLSELTWGTLLAALFFKATLLFANSRARRSERERGRPADLFLWQNSCLERASVPLMLLLCLVGQWLALRLGNGVPLNLPLIVFLMLPSLAWLLAIFQWTQVRCPEHLRLPDGYQREALDWESRARALLLAALGFCLLIPLAAGVGPTHVPLFGLVTMGLWLLGTLLIDLIQRFIAA